MTEKDTESVPLAEGSLWRNIWQMAWPMMIIMVLNFLVGLTDMYVAGLLSSHVQAAVGFVAQLYFLVVIVANAVSTGTIALIARAIGAGDHTKAAHTGRQALLFGILSAGLLSASGLIFAPQIIAAAGLPSEIRDMATTFFRIFVFVLGPNYLLIITNAVFNASGEVKKPLATMSIVAVVNLTAVFALVFGFGPVAAFGYRGIALATAAAVTTGMGMNLLFLSLGRWRSILSGPFSFSSSTIGAIVRIGWPAAMLQITWNAGSILLYNILGRLGSGSITALAALAGGLRIEGIIYLPAFALNMAASVLVGQNLGAGEPERAGKVGWRIAFSGVFFISALALGFYVYAGHLAGAITREGDVAAETARYLRFNMFSEPFMALSAILGGALQGAGDTRGTLKVVGSCMWLIRLPLAWLLGIVLDYGAPGVWTAMVISMCIQGILMAMRFRRGAWQHLRIGKT